MSQAVPGAEVLADALRPGTVLPAAHDTSPELTVGPVLASRGQARLFSAMARTGEEHLILECPWPHLRTEPWVERCQDARIARPMRRCHGAQGQAVLVYAPQAGVSVTRWLAEEDLPSLSEILRFGQDLCEAVETVHAAGRCLLSLDPDLVMRTPSGGTVLLGVDDPPVPGGAAPHLVPATAAPEVMHRIPAMCGMWSDVYAVAAILHALVSHHELWPPPPGMSAVLPHHFSPRTWRPALPLGLWPALADALSPDPSFRTGHMAGLRHALRRFQVGMSRPAALPGTLRLSLGHAVHMGVGKEQRGGAQQDRVLVSQRDGVVLAAVADGVSQSIVGDGGTAAEHTVAAVAAAGPLLLEVQDAVSLRARMKRVVDEATAAICLDANTRSPGPEVETAGVMASTLVLARVHDDHAMLMNLGDSRAYLFNGQTVESVCLDHDRRTEAIRSGLDPYYATMLGYGGALTRAVGRVSWDGTRLAPNPSAPEFFELRLHPGDRLILCSDGLSDFAVPQGSLPSPGSTEGALRQVMARARSPQEAADALVDLANQNGGEDNIAVVVLFAD